MKNLLERKTILTMFILLVVIGGCFFFILNNPASIKDLQFYCNYDINVTLEPAQNTFFYSEEAKVSNIGEDLTSELYFNLYINKDLDAEEQIKVISAVDEAGNAVNIEKLNDGQLFRIDLNQPLEVGEETSITFQCQADLPILAVNYGVGPYGEIQIPFFNLQLAVYEETGWDIAPSCTNSDGRHSEVADYNLKITAPSEYQVACTGQEISMHKEVLNGQSWTTYCLEAPRRRDIMAAAYKNYLRLERTVGDTTIIGFFNLEQSSEAVAQTTMDKAAFAVDYFNQIYIKYPHKTLVVASAALGTRTISNMEYSGYVTLTMGDSAAMGGKDEHDAYNVETLYHEIAHQWFYFLVGNDENKEPWLDEGFASFSSNLCLEAAGDQAALSWNFYKNVAERYPGYAVNTSADKMSYLYYDISYLRGAHFLAELMKIMGRDDFLCAISEYCHTYVNKIATTQDLLNIFSANTNQDLTEIFQEYTQTMEKHK